MGTKIENVTFFGEVKDGKLTVNNRHRFEQYLSALNGKVKVTIERIKKVRTTGKPGERSNLNGYYWFYLSVIADENRDNVNDLHEYFKRAVLPPRFAVVLGKTIKLPATTTELTGAEMMDFMLRIEQLTGVAIPPHPDENY